MPNSISFEHIIQDGGSGGEFSVWAESQTSKCYIEEDSGMYDAINRGFVKAKGEILAWLNCDEQYLPGTLERVESVFKSNPNVDILFGDVIVANSSFELLCYRTTIAPLTGQIRYGFLPTFSAATFVRRKIIDDGHFLDSSFKAIADAVWIHKLIKLGYKTMVLNEPLSLFLQTGNNLGQSPCSLQESRIWRTTGTIMPSFWKLVHGLLHRLRKFIAGGYHKRTITIEVYIPGKTERQQIGAILGGKWQ